METVPQAVRRLSRRRVTPTNLLDVGRVTSQVHPGVHDEITVKLARGLLEEVVAISARFRSREIWRMAATDLARLCARDPRGDRSQNNLRAQALFEELVDFSRRNPTDADLGLDLTNLAVFVLDLEPKPRMVRRAKLLLEEALPLRHSPLDQAYTLLAMAQVYELDQHENPAARIRGLSDAIRTGGKAIDRLKRAPATSESARAIAEATILQGSRMVQRLRLRHDVSRVNAWRQASAPGVDSGSELWTEFTRLRMLMEATYVNPLLFGFEVAEAIAEEPLPMVEGGSERDELVETIELLKIAGEFWRDVGALESLARTEAVLASLLEALDGKPSELSRAAYLRALAACPPTTAPRRYLRWALSLFGDLLEERRWVDAIAVGDLATQALEALLSDASDDDSRKAVLGRAPMLARQLAYAHVKAGRLAEAVQVVEVGQHQAQRARRASETGSAHGPVRSGFAGPVVYILCMPEEIIFLASFDFDETLRAQAFAYRESGARELVTLLAGMSKGAPGLAFVVDSQSVGVWLTECYRQLSPIMSRLDAWLTELGIQEVALVPTGPFALLPFLSTPVDRRTGATPFGWARLTVLAPSRSSLASTPRSLPFVRRAVFLADPARGDLEPIPRSRAEAENAGAILEACGWETSVWLGLDATTRNLRSAQDASIVHVASHAAFDALGVTEPVLHLSDADISAVTLAASLASPPSVLVLSACESGRTVSLAAPNEASGFASAALAAGVGRVVASLWQVNDAATEQLMNHVYKALGEMGDRVFTPFAIAEALTHGQKMIANAHPDDQSAAASTWAAFVVYGA